MRFNYYCLRIITSKWAIAIMPANECACDIK